MKYLIFIFCCFYAILGQSLPAVENSIIKMVESCQELKNLPEKKYTTNQYKEITELLNKKDQRVRIVSYNILKEKNDGRYGKNNFWKLRFPRIVELILEMEPDILSVQELSDSQLNDIRPSLEPHYEFYGHPRTTDKEINGFFYRKNRFTVLTHQIDEIKHDIGSINHIVTLILNDRVTNKKFAVLTIHLPFFNPDKREFQIRSLLTLAKPFLKEMPVIVMGDLNLFPNRLDLTLPFHDGDYIHRLFSNEGFKDAIDTAVLGHLGPIATYTNAPHTGHIPFRGQGTPGVYLDRIYVSEQVQVLIHAVQAGTVDDFYPSDHMPVLIDCIFK